MTWIINFTQQAFEKGRKVLEWQKVEADDYGELVETDREKKTITLRHDDGGTKTYSLSEKFGKKMMKNENLRIAEEYVGKEVGVIVVVKEVEVDNILVEEKIRA